MTNERPLFSIITVTYNAEATLPPTLQSVAEQTCTLYEHLIVDGASTDGTADVVRRCGNPLVVFSSARDRGIYDAMNKGLAKAQGDYLIFLNAGDTFHSSETLRELADVIMDNDYPGVVYGQTNLVNAERCYVGPRHLTAPEQLTMDSFRNGMVVCHQAFVTLRKLAKDYDLRYCFSADYEWCIKVLQRSRNNVYVPEVIIDYLEEGATTRNRYKSLCERFCIMCRYYGTFSTIWRHLTFIPRFLRNRKKKAL